MEHLGTYTLKFQLEGSRAVVALPYKAACDYLKDGLQMAVASVDSVFKWLMNANSEDCSLDCHIHVS